MNIRREELTELLLSGLETKNIEPDDIIFIKFPDSLDNKAIDNVGEHIVAALKLLNKSNKVLLIPDSMILSTLNSNDLEKLGLRKINETPKDSNPGDSGLCKPTESPSGLKYINVKDTVSDGYIDNFWTDIKIRLSPETVTTRYPLQYSSTGTTTSTASGFLTTFEDWIPPSAFSGLFTRSEWEIPAYSGSIVTFTN